MGPSSSVIFTLLQPDCWSVHILKNWLRWFVETWNTSAIWSPASWILIILRIPGSTPPFQNAPKRRQPTQIAEGHFASRPKRCHRGPPKSREVPLEFRCRKIQPTGWGCKIPTWERVNVQRWPFREAMAMRPFRGDAKDHPFFRDPKRVDPVLNQGENSRRYK